MKNLKKTFALVLTIAMLATLFMVPVFADGHEDADKLETLGILVGSGDGVTEEYLAGEATRITAAILVLKLKGLEDEAKNWDGTENFNDADTAQSLYAKAIMGYLKENPEVGFVGDGSGNFNPYAVISAQEYYKVLLTALGYEQGVDFEWSEVLDFAASIGLDAIADVDGLTINDFAIATVEALNTEVKGTGMTLIEKLVDEGVVSEEDATAAGWVFAAVIESATQIGKNTIEVVFSTDVDTAAVVVKLKQGLVYYYATVVWNEAKDTATLTTAVNPIPAGTYTVEVTGLEETMTMDVTAAAPVATSIDITTSILYTGSSSIAFSVMNQFGEDMAVAGTSVFGTAYIVTAGTGGTVGAVTLTGEATSAFTYSDGDTVPGDVMQVTLVYMGMTVTKAFTIQADPAASTIAFGTVAPLTGDAYIFVNKTDYVIPYELFDQYGNSIKLPAGTGATIGNITFNSSITGAVDPATFAVDGDGVLTFDTGATAGTAVITAVWNATVVGQISITVTAAPAPASAVISAPTVLIAEGEAVSLDVVVTDQFGTVHANDSAAVQGLTVTGTNCDAVISATTKKLEITNTVEGTATVDILNGATKIGTISFTVQPAAVATAITGTTFTTLFQAGAELTVARDTINVLDQYGRAFAGGTVVVTDGPAVHFTVTTSPTIEAVSEGTDVVSVQVGSSNVFPVTVTCVADTDITMYSLASNKATIYTSTDSDYFATMTLSGKTSGGMAVVLDGSLPSVLTSSNDAIAAIETGLQVSGVAAGTATIYAWDGATLLASTTITVSDAAPVAQSITFDGTSLYVGDNIADDILVITDQYGVNIASAGGFVVASDDTGIIDATGDAVSDGTVNITVVKNSVVSATTEVEVMPVP